MEEVLVLINTACGADTEVTSHDSTTKLASDRPDIEYNVTAERTGLLSVISLSLLCCWLTLDEQGDRVI